MLVDGGRVDSQDSVGFQVVDGRCDSAGMDELQSLLMLSSRKRAVRVKERKNCVGAEAPESLSRFLQLDGASTGRQDGARRDGMGRMRRLPCTRVVLLT